MEIIVQSRKIETKDIVSITDIESNKSMFLNREAGFIIYFIDNGQIKFKQDIPYDSTPNEISKIKHKWDKLQSEVYKIWREDKIDIPTFNTI
jgi:hypothetical protein